MMSLWLESSRTMNGISFCPAVPSWRVSLAMYTPETASVGTVHDAETDQLPASTIPVAASRKGFGWVCTPVCWIVSILRAPKPRNSRGDRCRSGSCSSWC